MRQYFSAIAIAARSTIYKILAIMILMTTVEIALFTAVVNKFPADYPFLLEEVIVQSKIPFIFAITFLALCAILCMFGLNGYGSQVKYTINRLSISEKTISMLWSVYNIFCFILLWAVQLITVFLLSKIYLNSINSSFYNTHTVFLTFYNSDFLHSLLPLDEYSRYIRNIILILGLSLSCTCFSFKQRRGKKSFSFIVLAIITMMFFSQGIGNFSADLFLSIISLIASMHSIYTIWWGEYNEE